MREYIQFTPTSGEGFSGVDFFPGLFEGDTVAPLWVANEVGRRWLQELIPEVV
jgi:hypothetical protein